MLTPGRGNPPGSRSRQPRARRRPGPAQPGPALPSRRDNQTRRAPPSEVGCAGRARPRHRYRGGGARPRLGEEGRNGWRNGDFRLGMCHGGGHVAPEGARPPSWVPAAAVSGRGPLLPSPLLRSSSWSCRRGRTPAPTPTPPRR